MPKKVSELKPKEPERVSLFKQQMRDLDKLIDGINKINSEIYKANEKRRALISTLKLIKEQDNYFPNAVSDGVTKREQFAVNILHAFVEGSVHLGFKNRNGDKERIEYAEASVKYADALINALKKVEPKQLPGPSKPKQRR
jgi:hypothetical protein